ncbi:sensor histidine kinase [Hydrogenophaga sp. R2]|uniref:sensor histidine kinase n=1 Tax=Hydrogenophaga sp. R2 TaxID=3132827 RepID=UPI003CF04070
MKDSRILSTFQELPGSTAARPLASMPEHLRARAEVFDAVQVGVVLRAVCFVQAIVAVAVMFHSAHFAAWLYNAAVITGAALPALLIWLLSVFALRRVMARLQEWQQWMLGAALGAASGLYGCALLVWLGFVDHRPWWASAAAGTLVSLVLMAGLIWRARARMPAGTKAQLAELQARIRPHFLFNTLNSAIALVREEPALAEDLLENLSELFRHALADTKEAVTLRQELSLAEHYLAIEQVRFGERLRVEWSVDETSLGARLPPLILQPLVENAVKHGVEPSPTGATVRISTHRRGSIVVIKVTNTVPGGTGKRGNGLALDNVRQRLALLHDVQGRFQSALVDGVFQVRLEIPV